MGKQNQTIVILTISCILATGIIVPTIGGIDAQELEAWVSRVGVLAPVIYILLYIVGTWLILPSTPLNLAGGAVFGVWWGTLWTTIAAMIAAIAAFIFSRTVGRKFISQKFAGRWDAVDGEIRQGGLFYMFAIRLLPIIPYGIVNFIAGLTSIKFKDYLIGTLLGTLPGVLPFVMIGAGMTQLSQGKILPLLCALTLVAILVAAATWYRRQRRPPPVSNHDSDR